MNRIVKENYPVSKLPDDLKEGLDSASVVTVTINQQSQPPKDALTLEEIFARRRPPFRSKEDIDAGIRRLRDERDD